jgi:hypothetical protein
MLENAVNGRFCPCVRQPLGDRFEVVGIDIRMMLVFHLVLAYILCSLLCRGGYGYYAGSSTAGRSFEDAQ